MPPTRAGASSAQDPEPLGWLRRYATGYHRWQRAQHDGVAVFYRPLGVVEKGFDNDGTYHEGRADINLAMSFEIKTTQSRARLRQHILLAWTNLRLRHPLLSATATGPRDYMDQETAQRSDRFFTIPRPTGPEHAIDLARDPLVFLDDHYSSVDADQLYFHAQNVGRTFDATRSLVKVMVLPLQRCAPSTYSLRFLFVEAHQISDGLTNANWTGDFKQLLNNKTDELRSAIPTLISTLHERLPPSQEDLYPPISGSRARQRWFWAVTLVLRHVQKPLPPAFQNPLRYPNAPIKASPPELRLFDKILDYDKVPPLNSGTVIAHIGRTGTRRLHRVCREVGCSLGAGSFVLAGVVMMEIYEKRFPEIPLHERHAFIGSFPINPRPFFNHRAKPDSLMLAFSDGVVLPFLSSDLDLDGRIRLLVRSAQRQLSRYQKRPRNEVEHMRPRGAGRVIPMNYLDVIERANNKLPGHLRKEFPYQKTLPKQINPTMATCGVSSVGRSDPSIIPGQIDLTRPLAGEDHDALIAEILGTRQNVRPRDGEFLVGIWGGDDFIDASVSYDSCAIDPAWAQVWKERMEAILDGQDGQAKL
ncbi:hypothetical protein KVR01_003241 [Diaporthe batatas]|uniref:uncharacterized protein n=1 Tax=Diaporthe batatas TaxID=748121 RepID=UPI001D04B96C|nr:uncharacterized protein KVR01_003241 [Diaporthe batatas]KAG8167552.1 hypothetical protein KVR01_003241 [Diaporthe batatas]